MFKRTDILYAIVTTLILSNGLRASAQGYDVSLPQQCNLNNPGTTEVLQFPNNLGNADGDATLTITSIGDIASSSATSTEHLDYYDENMVKIGQDGPAGNCALDVFTYTMPKADVLAFSADGIIEITVVPRSGVNTSQCSGQIGTAAYCSAGRLEYPTIRVPNDAGVLSVDEPANCEGTHDVVVTVRNFGINVVNSVTVNWSLDGVTQSPVNLTLPLDTFGGSGINARQVTLGPATLTNGITANIAAWTSNPNGVQDTVTKNDSASLALDPIQTVSNFPYLENFEAGQGSWITGGINSSWAFGTPAKTTIIGASSGSKAFVTGGLGTAVHNNDEQSYVYSPCFDLNGFVGTPWVAMDVWWNCELGWDGAALQYSIDGGRSWDLVGQLDDPYNWYSDTTLEGMPGGQSTGWTGRASEGNSGSGGWVNAKNSLDQSTVGQLVRFRVAFGADEATQDDGFGFDDFRIVDYTPAEFTVDRQSMCQQANLTLDPKLLVNGTVKWSTGATTPTLVVANTGQYWVEYTDTLIDLTTSDTLEVIQSPPLVINWAPYSDTVYSDGSVTLNPSLPLDVNYTWTPGGNTFPYYVVRGSDYAPGTYTFTLDVVDSVLCSDNDAVTLVVVSETGIGEQSLLDRIHIYPNPAADIVNIELNNLTGNVRMKIRDLNGRSIHQERLANVSNSTISIDVSGIETGLYMLEIENEGSQAIYKLMIE